MTLENVLQMIINIQNRTNELFTSEAQSKDILFRDYLISYLRSIDGETRSRSFFRDIDSSRAYH
jgi:hypothetical protein